eukprot:scaffold153220_cov68-Attheya_sp.AAC.6
MWVPIVQIETALIGGNSGGSRARIWWGRIDQASVGGRQRSNKSTPEARKQDMPLHFLKS